MQFFYIKGKDVCIGPLIKYTVFDAFFGALCGLILIFGSLKRSQASNLGDIFHSSSALLQFLMVTWMVLTIVISLKYALVVLTHDWTALEVTDLLPAWINYSFSNFSDYIKHV